MYNIWVGLWVATKKLKIMKTAMVTFFTIPSKWSSNLCSQAQHMWWHVTLTKVPQYPKALFLYLRNTPKEVTELKDSNSLTPLVYFPTGFRESMEILELEGTATYYWYAVTKVQTLKITMPPSHNGRTWRTDYLFTYEQYTDFHQVRFSIQGNSKRYNVIHRHWVWNKNKSKIQW